IPLVLGCIDRSYPGNGNFPPVPILVPWLNPFWFTWKCKGEKIFNPSNSRGNPQLLNFVEEICISLSMPLG
ncbi:hypothetical protein EJ02DRAFT_361640, partial [Clathrospora elynae]